MSRRLIPWVLFAALAGCGDATPSGNLCTPGLTISCPCLGGAMGVQVCQPAGAYAACQCPGGSDAGSDVVATDVFGPDVVDVPSAPDVVDVPSAPDVVDVPSAPDVVDAAASPDVVDASSAPDIVDVPPAMDVVDASSATDVVDARDVVDAPALPDVVDVPAVADAGSVPSFCAPGAVIDLATAGTREGTITTYHGNSAAAPLDQTLGEACVRTVAPVFHRYTTRGEARLRISTQTPGTDPAFDGVLVVTDACGAMTYGGATRMLGCNDNYSGGAPAWASTVVLPSVPAGTTVYIAVAGLASATQPRGAYTLAVVEAPLVGLGVTCDRLELASACVAGTSCSVTAPPRCVADGALDGACRGSIPSCNAGLGCLGGRCVTASMTTSCSPVCPSTSVCLTVGGTAQCVPYGALNGRCRAAPAVPCDGALQCSSASLCLPAVSLGAACDANGRTNACAAGSNCVAGVCRAIGADGGRCRADLTQPTCDGSLVCSDVCVTCSSVTCVPTVAVGGSCAPPPGCGNPCYVQRCATGSSCMAVGTALLCVANGALGTPCRRSTTQPLCDAGLTCRPVDGTCLPTIAEGAACGSFVTGTCATGTYCASIAGVQRCAPLPYAETTVAGSGYIDACALGRVEPFATTSLQNNQSRAPIALPFPFTYYGVAQTYFAPATGAWGTFGTTRPSGSSLSFASTVLPTNALAPFALSIDGNYPVVLQASGSRLCVATVGTAPNRRFAVEWSDFSIANVGAAAHLDFEVVLHEGTNAIEYYYPRMEPATGPLAQYTNGTGASIGMTGPTGAPAVIHRGPIATNVGLRFTPR